MAGEKERLTAYFSGRVQGVGFRAGVCDLAGNYDVEGFVKNLADGRVELQAEGEPGELDRFLEAIRDSHLGPNVRRVEESRKAARGGLGPGFGVDF